MKAALHSHHCTCDGDDSHQHTLVQEQPLLYEALCTSCVGHLICVLSELCSAVVSTITFSFNLL
jgi:hypothetical protein